jgi:hypothetical protein
VHLLRMYLHGDKDDKLPDDLVPEVRFIVENPPVHAGGHAEHEWKSFALRLAHTNPLEVLRASVKLAVKWRSSDNFANAEAIEVLTVLAVERPGEVLKAVIEALATEEVPHFIHLEQWQKLFLQFDPAQLEAEVEPLGIDFIRELGTLMPDPKVEEGKVHVPAVTEWYLKKHGADDLCLRNFEIGRWSGRVRTGWAWQAAAANESNRPPSRSPISCCWARCLASLKTRYLSCRKRSGVRTAREMAVPVLPTHRGPKTLGQLPSNPPPQRGKTERNRRPGVQPDQGLKRSSRSLSRSSMHNRPWHRCQRRRIATGRLTGGSENS